MILDCVFISNLKKVRADLKGSSIAALVEQKARQLCELAAMKNSCSNKENKISNMIESRLKALAACLP